MCPMPSFERLNRRYGPWVSLALGVAAVVYVRRGLGFAPVAVGVLMLAWIGAAALRRLAPVVGPAGSPWAAARAAPPGGGPGAWAPRPPAFVRPVPGGAPSPPGNSAETTTGARRR